MSRNVTLRRKIRKILAQSYNWHNWQNALESALFLEQIADEGHKFLYCVDTSEVVEYVSPDSLQDDTNGREEYPTPLDLSLLIIFGPGREVFILPPHFMELRSFGRHWAERARQAIQKFTLLQEALQTYEARIEDLRRNEDASMDQFVQFVLREGRSFGLIFWLSSGGRSFEQAIQRLQLPDREKLRIGSSWSYQPDLNRVESLHQLFEEAGRLGKGSSANHRRDAHALHFLEVVNAAMPADWFLILTTHSGNVWKILEEIRQIDGGSLCKPLKNKPEDGVIRNISLVQRPQVALIRKLLWEAEQGRERDELRQQLVLEKERNQSLDDLRARLENNILPYLERGQSHNLDLSEVGKLVQDLDEGLEKLKSVSLDRQRLERARLALEASIGQLGPLARLREVINGERLEELKDLIQKELDSILKELGGIQQRLSLGASAIPETSLSFEEFREEEPSAGMRGILYSRPGGMAYTIHFQSPGVEKHLMRIQELLRALDEARNLSEGEQRKLEEQKVRLDLQREMYKCEVRLQEEPEYYLLLASVYSSRDMWFQAFDAADQGLKMLFERGNPEDFLEPSLQVASAWTELLLAKAMAFTSWTLEGYVDLPSVATTFLGQAADLARRCLKLQEKWANVLPYYSSRDPRCLRELGIIYGTAWTVGIDPEPHVDDCIFAETEIATGPTLLDLFLQLSRVAYRELQHVKDEVWAYYENSLLYALSERDSDDDLLERSSLAEALSSRPEAEEQAKILDTLAWHHFRLAQRRKKAGKAYQSELETARSYIDKAVQKVSKGNRYYTLMHREHQKKIVDLLTSGDTILP
jgi:hypothetical protein